MFLFEHLCVTARVMHNGYISSFFFSQADSAAASGRSTILPRRDSRQGAQDVWAGPGSRKGEGDVSYTSLSKYAHTIFAGWGSILDNLVKDNKDNSKFYL